MQQAFDAILDLFAIFLVQLFSIPWVWGYSLGSFLVACSLLVLLWRLVLWIFGSLSRSTVRGARRSVLRRAAKK